MASADLILWFIEDRKLILWFVAEEIVAGKGGGGGSADPMVGGIYQWG